ncbi:replication initiation protein [Enterococcus cecorum]|uniref:replication initiation protein n=1 Tax=Enterococcus cecorum TaxID=44008 RepID=UPI001FAC3E63|nr:replication initiation protein [Enterococcus cecorum]MCJ0597502.1 replication initiation protein [Enterococcus cecorum]
MTKEIREIKPTIIKHDPELNTIPLKDFTAVEMDLFFSIVAKVQEKGDSLIRLYFSDLKELSDYKATANKRFVDDIYNTYKKLSTITFGTNSKSGLRRQLFVMFTKFDINGDAEKPYVDIKVNEMAIPLINNLDRWVRYTLQEFGSLESRYSKTMYRLLKQYRTTGKAYYTKETLFELLDVPASYAKKMTNFDKKVLEPIIKELKPIFMRLRVKKIHADKRGRPVIAYEFSFTPEPKDKPEYAPIKPKRKKDKRDRPPITMYNWLEGK